MRWHVKLLILASLMVVVAFPITASYIEAGLDTALNYWIDFRSHVLTLAIAYVVGWLIWKVQAPKLRVPAKSKKAKKHGMSYEL